MTTSTKRGTLNLADHVDPQFVEQLLAMGSWSVSTLGYIIHGKWQKDSKKIHMARLHRVVWELTYGPIPAGMCIDHRDRDRRNCRLENLRLVTPRENLYNTDALGYCWHKNAKKWQALIQFDGKLMHLGYFKTQEEARAAYLGAKAVYHVIPERTPTRRVVA